MCEDLERKRKGAPRIIAQPAYFAPLRCTDPVCTRRTRRMPAGMQNRAFLRETPLPAAPETGRYSAAALPAPETGATPCGSPASPAGSSRSRRTRHRTSDRLPPARCCCDRGTGRAPNMTAASLPAEALAKAGSRAQEGSTGCERLLKSGRCSAAEVAAPGRGACYQRGIVCMDCFKECAHRPRTSGGGLGTAVFEFQTSSRELGPMGRPRSRRSFLRVLAGAGGAIVVAPGMWSGTGGRVTVDSRRPLLPAPEAPADWPAWREALAEWRRETQARLAYDDVLYRHPEFGWAARCFCCCFLMVGDEAFYDRASGNYRVTEFLEHGVSEFGGYDAVVLWHAYPRIGVDERNQFDFYRELPGGLPGVRDVVRAFRARGVRVFLDYNPWDTGTRREGADDLEVLARLVEALEADGIFLDTMDRGGAAFRSKLDAVRPGVVLEGELALPVERVADHHLSWAQWFEDSQAPGVLRNKWFERRHLQHQIRRWDVDHSGELHTAWMNGSGMMVWENVFGSWVGWSPRDRSILRSMLPIQRRYAGSRGCLIRVPRHSYVPV